MNRNLKLIALSVMVSGSFAFAQQTDEMGNQFDKTGPESETVAPSGKTGAPTAGTVAGPGSAATMSAPVFLPVRPDVAGCGQHPCGTARTNRPAGPPPGRVHSRHPLQPV